MRRKRGVLRRTSRSDAMQVNQVTADNTDALKSFALVMMWAIPLLFIVIIPWLFSTEPKYGAFSVTVLFGLLYLIYPRGLYPFYRVWMVIAGILGWINSRLLLGMVFYLLILPIGFVMRTFGKLNYRAKLQSERSTYWIETPDNLDNNDLERPF